MTKKPVTIYDVAREVGVAPSTVSRAFSRPGRVSAATHTTVMEAAERLGYRTQAPAVQRSTASTQRIGIELPDITNPYFAELVAGVQEAANEQGYMVLLMDTREDHDMERAGLLQAVEMVDGILLTGSRMSDASVTHVLKRRPVVVLNRAIAGIDSVIPDYAAGIEQAVAHLRDCGARTVAYVAGPVNSWSDAERWRCLRASASRHGLQARRLGPFAPTAAGGETAFAQLRENLPHAVIAYNDLMALGLLAGALRAGVRVPSELSIIGHDDIPMARLFAGGLTTIASPKAQQGRIAVERLIRRIERPGADREPLTGRLPMTLVVRRSTGTRQE